MTPIRVTGAKEGPGGHTSYEFKVVRSAEKVLARIERCALNGCWATTWLDGMKRCVSCGRLMQ